MLVLVKMTDLISLYIRWFNACSSEIACSLFIMIHFNKQNVQ